MKTIKFPNNLYPWQKEFLEDIDTFHTDEFKLIISPRQKFAKSTTLALVLIKAAFSEVGTSIYIAPTLSQARGQFEDIYNMMEKSNLIKSANASVFEISFKNGSKISFRSAAQQDSIRGMTATTLLCYDESSFISNEFILKSLPLRTVHNALTIFVSTPLFMSGMFWDLYNDPKVKKYNWSKYIDQVYTKEELERLKSLYTPNMFRSEILGEFISSGGLLFQNINECIKESSNRNKLYIGIDLSSAVGGDYTVISVLNADREQVFLWYDNLLEPAEKMAKMSSILNSFSNVQKIYLEGNNAGKTYLSLLKKSVKWPITEWTTTESSKRDIVQNLQMAFENKNISILSDTEQTKELQNFGAKVNAKTKKVTYEGINCNDDCVLALCFALKALESNLGTYRLV